MDNEYKILKVENLSGSSIPKYAVVVLDGMGSFHPKVAKSNGSSGVDSFGIALTQMQNGSIGEIQSDGFLSIDTTDWANGTDLYSSAGGVLSDTPNGPVVATVIDADVNGTIQILSQSEQGSSNHADGVTNLAGLSDVDLAGLDTNDFLKFDGDNWVPSPLDPIPASTDDLSEGDNLYFTDSRAKSAAVADAINDGTTDVAPSQNAVFDRFAAVTKIVGFTRYVDGVNGHDTTGNGSVALPFKTIQKAIDDMGSPTSSADALNIRHVMVYGGVYNESLTIPKDGVWKLISMGLVVLGSGDLQYLASTTARNVTWNNEPTTAYGSVRPSLCMTSFPSIYAGSTHIAYGSSGWIISGNLTLGQSGVSASTTELHLVGVKVTGNVDASARSGTINIYVEKCFFDAATAWINQSSAILIYANETEFDGVITVNQLGHIKFCEIDGASYTGGWNTAILPYGFFGCNLVGTYTSGAGNYRADGTTQALSSGITLAGGNTLTDLG